MDDKQRISSRFKLLTATLLASFSYCLVFFFAENWSRPVYDLLFRIRGPLPVSEDIVIVAIDEISFDEMNLQWPWPRGIHALLLDALYSEGAKTVALDIMFAEPQNDEQDTKLANAISRQSSTILATDFSYFSDPVLGFDQIKITAPDPLLNKMSEPAKSGFVSIAPEADGYLRRLRLNFPEGRAFSLEAAMSFAPERVGPYFLSDVPKLEWINFSGPARSIPTYSYFQALDAKQWLPPNAFKNKLVFVGLSSSAEANIYSPTADHFLIPFSRENGAYFPGVEVHANAARSILEDSFISSFDQSKATSIGVTLGFASAFIFLAFPPLVSSFLYAFGLFLLFAISVYAFADLNFFLTPVHILLPFSLSFLACPFIHYWFTYKQKAFIRRAFSTYLAPSLVQELIENPDRLELGGTELEGTVVFLDLAGFTGFSEKLSPKDLIDLINRNLGACAEVILKWNGMIDKYIGDCIMAVWGVPVASSDHAKKACHAIFEITNVIKVLAEKERAITGVGLSVRVGANTGPLIAGNVGGGQQFNYTVLGNEVNLASRLEGTNKTYHTDVIVSEATKSAAGPEFLFREIDLIRVVGQKVPVKIYQLWGMNEMTEPQKQLDSIFQEGRSHYLRGEWQLAEKKFSEALSFEPNDGPSATYLERCQEYAITPPDADWAGVYQMRSK